MTRKHIWLGLIILALPLWGHVSPPQDEALVRSFVDLSTEDHYWAAVFRFETMSQTSSQSTAPEKLENFQEAQKLLGEAFRQYKFYDTGEEVFLTDNWRSGMNRISQPGSLDLAQSPLSLLAHLFLAWESGQQRAGQIMIQAVQYSDSQIRRNEALDKANDLMRQVLEAAQKGTGWVVHQSSSDRFFLELPANYEALATNPNMPVNAAKKFSDGSPQRGAVVSILEVEHTIAPEAYVNARITERRKKFADLSDFVLEYARGDGYEVRALFSHTYTWKGDKIKTLVFHHKSGQRTYEVSCVALVDHFDREEFESFLRSFHKM
ncbi:MAG: hypothetical protein WBB73_05640 [Candidatus Aminicenantaceae bacterium]